MRGWGRCYAFPCPSLGSPTRPGVKLQRIFLAGDPALFPVLLTPNAFDPLPAADPGLAPVYLIGLRGSRSRSLGNCPVQSPIRFQTRPGRAQIPRQGPTPAPSHPGPIAPAGDGVDRSAMTGALRSLGCHCELQGDGVPLTKPEAVLFIRGCACHPWDTQEGRRGPPGSLQRRLNSGPRLSWRPYWREAHRPGW